MNRLLLEYLGSILDERTTHAPGQTWETPSGWAAKNLSGKTRYKFATKDAAQAWLDGKQSGTEDDTGTQQPGQEEPKEKRTGTTDDTPQGGIYGTPSGESNAESVLQREVREGHIGNAPPGNEFSHYQEPMSVIVARWIIDNPDASDREIMEYLTSIDCEGELLSRNVSSTLPKKYNSEFKELSASGAFSNNCSKKYPDSKNKARFMTMIMAKNKAERMRAAVGRNNMSEVQFDSFSGDSRSLSAMRSFVENLPDDAIIRTETGGQLTKKELLKYISGFGTSRFPADTAMIGQSPTGEVIFMGFSDKKDLKAIINNSTVTFGIRRNKELLNNLVERGIITPEIRDQVSSEIDSHADEYEQIESELKTLTTLPAKKLVEIISTDPARTRELIDKVKNMSTGSDPEKYWNNRIKKVFEGAASGKGAHKAKIKYLTSVGWKPGDELTDEIMFAAWTQMSLEMLESDTEDLPKDDQEILFRMEVIDNRQLIEKQGEIRDRSLAVLERMRTSLNAIEIPTKEGRNVPLGTYLDAVDAWKSLHFDMSEYNGALSMAAGDQIVDYADIERCLEGLSDHREFAETLSIETSRIRHKMFREYTTGQNIEVFTVAPGGKRISVGVRTIRSKDGPLGRLQTTFNFHPDFQKCLEGEKNKD